MSEGYIHSLQSLGTVDGPGVRAVVFAQGCPLRCVYCHNPDTWRMTDGVLTDAHELALRIERLLPYIKNGGVTFSGGEPCMQAEFFTELAGELHGMGLHIALDTSGCVWNSGVSELIDAVDLVLLDLKFTSENAYKSNTGCDLATVLAFLGVLRERGKPTWIRQVVVPGMNDTPEAMIALRELIRPYPNIERVELLPFRKLCLEKYEAMGIDFPLADTPEMGQAEIDRLYALFVDTSSTAQLLRNFSVSLLSPAGSDVKRTTEGVLREDTFHHSAVPLPQEGGIREDTSSTASGPPSPAGEGNGDGAGGYR